MKIKLKMTRTEMKGIATVVQCCCNALSGEEFEAVQYRDALVGLLLKLAARMTQLKNKNSLMLTDMEALALWETMKEVSMAAWPPLEMSVGYTVLTEIDLQKSRYVSLMKGNLGLMFKA